MFSSEAKYPVAFTEKQLPPRVRLLLREYLQLVEEAKTASGVKDNQAQFREKMSKCQIAKLQLTNESDALLKKGNEFLQQHKLNEALQCYQQMLFIVEKVGDKSSIKAGLALGSIGNVLTKLRKNEEALACSQQSLQILEKIHGKNSDKLTVSLVNIATILESQNKFEQACVQLEQALLISKEDSSGRAMVLNNLALIYVKQDKHAKALQCHEQALVIHKKHFGEKSSQVALSYDNLGRVYKEQGKYPEALRHHEEALSMRTKLFGKKHRDVALTLCHIGDVYFKQHNSSKALEYYEKSLAISQDISDTNSTEIAHLLQNIANVYFTINEYKLALDYNQKTLEMNTHLYGKNSLQSSQTLMNIANIHAKQDNYPLAHEYYKQVLPIFEQVFGKESSHVAVLILNMGNTLLNQSDHGQALKYFNQALAIYQRVFGEMSTEVGGVLNSMGALYSEQDNNKQALTCFRSALTIFEKQFGRNSSHVAGILNNMVTLFLKQGNCEQAFAYCEKALEINKNLIREDSDAFANALANMGNILLKQKKHQAASEYYGKALNIKKRIYGENSSEIAEIVGNFGHILADHALFQPALAYYRQGLNILQHLFGKNNTRSAMLLGSIGTLYSAEKKYDKALEYYQSAEDIFKQTCGEKSDQMATTLNNIGGVLAEQQKYDQSLLYYQRAFAIRRELTGTTHYAACEVRLRLVRVHVELAGVSEVKIADQHYQCVATHYEEMIAINRTILDKRIKEFTVYDFVGHNRLLTAVTYLYARQGKLAQAGKVYYEEAKRYQDISPILTLYYSDSALKYLPRTGYEKMLIEIYQMRVRIAFEHQRYHFAIQNVHKALALDKNAKDCHSQLRQCQDKQAEYLRYVDKDIYSQLEHCRDSYDVIQLLLLEELESKKTLSENVINRVTELIIKINSLLDMAFGRFTKSVLRQSGNEAKHHDLYYLPASSSRSFIKNLKRQGLMVDPSEFEESILGELKKPSLISRNFLKKYGYLDEKCEITTKIQRYPLLNDLKEEANFIREKIATLLMGEGVGKVLSRGKLAEFNKQVQSTIEYQPPSKESILTELEKNGFITRDQEAKPPGRTCQLTAKFKVEQENFSLKLMAGQPEEKQFLHYEPQIIKKIQGSVTYKKSLFSININCPDVYALLEREQPFYYYSEEANKTTPHVWEQSWLEKIIAVSNGSKHIGLTSHGVADNLAEQVGTLRRDNLHINLHYIESAFYPWTFVTELQNTTSLENNELLNVSRNLLHVLKQKNYLKNGFVEHPLARRYLEVAKKSNDYNDREQIEREFCQQLKTDLPKKLQVYAPTIAILMLQRMLQLSHLELYSDQQANLHILIGKSLMATQTIVMALGKASSKKEMKADTADIFKASTLKRSSAEHSELAHRAHMFYVQGDIKQATEHYVLAAQKAPETSAFLRFHYYHKAFAMCSIDLQNPEALQKVCLLLSENCIDNGLLSQSLMFLVKSIKMLGPSKTKLLQEKLLAHQQKIVSMNFIDSDIHSQLQHAKHQFLQFEYYCYKLTENPDNQYLQYRIENALAEIAIKLRHLLDQAFTRLVHHAIYIPNNRWVAIQQKYAVKFYAYFSKEELEKDLLNKHIMCEEKSMASLDSAFPEVYQLLVRAQPFSCVDPSENWLSKIINLSNHAKHEGLPFSLTADFLSELEKMKLLFKTTLSEVDHALHVIFTALSTHSNKNSMSKSHEVQQSPYRLFISVPKTMTETTTNTSTQQSVHPADEKLHLTSTLS